MPSHAQVEEVEDSDVDMSDPSEVDLDDFADGDIMRRVNPTAPPQTASSSSAAAAAARQHILNPAAGNMPNILRQPSSSSQQQPQMASPANAAMWADFQCIYPVYFDASRTRAEGRRVSRSLAVRDPLAVEIKNACEQLGLPTVLEVNKTHPKDWANPGRVKVALKKINKDGGMVGMGGVKARDITNKHHLYLLVAKHLQAHPTTDASAALRFHLPGAPPPPSAADPSNPWPRPAVPRGWKMNELLPSWSHAMTGGGVSENMFKDMMKELQGGGGPGDMASLLGGGGGAPGPSSMARSGSGGVEEKRKKEKKGKGKG